MRCFAWNLLISSTAALLAFGCTKTRSDKVERPAKPPAAKSQIALESLRAGRPARMAITTPKIHTTTPRAVFSGSGLRPGAHEYFRTIHIAGKKIEGTVTTAVAESTRDGRPVWQLTEDTQPELGGHKDITVLDRNSLNPISRVVSQYGSRVELSFSKNQVSGEIATGPTKLPVDVTLEGPILTAGTPAHLAFTTLPLEEGHTKSVVLLDPGTAAVQAFVVKVEATEKLAVPAGAFDAFRVKLDPSDGKGERTTVWIEASAERRLLKTEVVNPSVEPRWQKRTVSELVK
jgi:hypothetical protein